MARGVVVRHWYTSGRTCHVASTLTSTVLYSPTSEFVTQNIPSHLTLSSKQIIGPSYTCSLIYTRAAYRALITRRIIFTFQSTRRHVTSSAKVMTASQQPDPGVIILPRSLLDTDLYKARTSNTGDVSCLQVHIAL